AGDANLDGKLNIDDYVRIDTGIAAHTTGWSNGDFNYDGKINIDDYVILDGNIGTQGPPLTGAAVLGVVAETVPVARSSSPAWSDLAWGEAEKRERMTDLVV